MPKYDKLVRDKIPDILDGQGLQYTIRKATGDDKKYYIQQKLLEEVNEFLIDPSIEELGDIQEVIAGLLGVYGWQQSELDSQVLSKRNKRGSFYKSIILEEIIS